MVGGAGGIEYVRIGRGEREGVEVDMCNGNCVVGVGRVGRGDWACLGGSGSLD